MTTRRIALLLVASVGVASVGLGSLGLGTVRAQGGHRRTPPPPPHTIPMAGTVIEWSVFVSSYGDSPSSRSPVPAAVTPVTLPEATGWSCTVSAPTRAAIDTEHWSEVRTLECQRGDAILSTTGFCQIASASWGARAALLSLGSIGADERLQVTVDCSVRN